MSRRVKENKTRDNIAKLLRRYGCDDIPLKGLGIPDLLVVPLSGKPMFFIECKGRTGHKESTQQKSFRKYCGQISLLIKEGDIDILETYLKENV